MPACGDEMCRGDGTLNWAPNDWASRDWAWRKADEER